MSVLGKLRPRSLPPALVRAQKLACMIWRLRSLTATRFSLLQWFADGGLAAAPGKTKAYILKEEAEMEDWIRVGSLADFSPAPGHGEDGIQMLEVSPTQVLSQSFSS